MYSRIIADLLQNILGRWNWISEVWIYEVSLYLVVTLYVIWNMITN